MSKDSTNSAKTFSDRFLTCGLCNQWFNLPRTLPCLHSFCHHCLAKNITEYFSKKSERRNGKSGKPNGYSCPTCCKEIEIVNSATTPAGKWVENFPVNSFLTDLVDIELLKRGEKTCGPCGRNGDRSDVTSWCKECRDGLCDKCTKVHNGMRISMDHSVLTKEEFMKHVALLQEQEEPCPKHHGKTLDMFCLSDKELCCPNCIAEEHRRCDRVVSIGDAIKKSKLDKDPEFLSKNIELYQLHIEAVVSDRSNKLVSLDEQRGKLLDEFAQIRINIINHLDKMEKTIKKEVNDIHAVETKELQEEIASSRRMMAAVSNAHELLRVTGIHGSNSRQMSTIEKVKAECLWYEDSMGQLRGKIQETEYAFELNETIETLLNKVKEFGKVSVRRSPSKLPPFPNTMTLEKSIEQGRVFKSTLSLKGRKVEFLKSADLRQDDDSNECWYTGATFLADGSLVLVDRANKKLKLFSKTYRLLNSLTFSSKPWDVTVINETEVAVSLPEEHGIQLFSLANDFISPTEYFSTDEACFGIKFVRGKFLALCYDGRPPSLKIISSDGRELAAIASDDDGSPLFSRPIYVTSNTAGTIIYISDERRGNITTLTETSEHCFTYSTLEMNHAAGLTLDREGNLYVCRNHSKSVQVVSPEGERVKTIISRDEVSYPRAIALDAKENVC
ncbi:hypothetical protein FSP39_006211 [Pinctada imbricata]|uniref:Uncharacterized protein n=1 Tax=Pinctada imbricata TaxID=66713 RepID=A0AA89BQL5_PINIB|nr:hypothetical protein FSP39_006211 [Pinctada imbricata]